MIQITAKQIAAHPFEVWREVKVDSGTVGEFVGRFSRLITAAQVALDRHAHMRYMGDTLDNAGCRKFVNGGSR